MDLVLLPVLSGGTDLATARALMTQTQRSAVLVPARKGTRLVTAADVARGSANALPSLSHLKGKSVHVAGAAITQSRLKNVLPRLTPLGRLHRRAVLPKTTSQRILAIGKSFGVIGEESQFPYAFEFEQEGMLAVALGAVEIAEFGRGPGYCYCRNPDAFPPHRQPPKTKKGDLCNRGDGFKVDCG